MKKRKMHITIITNDEKQEYNLLGEYDDKDRMISYQESSSLLTTVKLDLENQKLVRKNKDYSLVYQFQENKITENEIRIKQFNQSMILKIKTEKFLVTENKVEIIYILLDSNEKVSYEIKF